MKLAKEGIWIVAGQIATVTGTLALVRVLTELLDPAAYGELALALSVGSIITQVLMGGIVGSISRYYSVALEYNDLLSYLKTSLRLMFYGVAGACAIGLLLMVAMFKLGNQQWIYLIFLILIMSIVGSINSVLNAIQNSARQRATVAINSGLGAWLKIGMAVAIMNWLGDTNESVVLGYVLASVVMIIPQCYFILKLVDRNKSKSSITNQLANKSWLRQMISYAWPFSTWGLFSWMQQISDRWSLEKFATTEDVGHYVAVFQLGYTPIGVATNAMVNFISPILFQKLGDAKDNNRNRTVRSMTWKIAGLIILFTLLSFIVAMFYHAEIFKLLVSESFRDASVYFPWVILAGGLFAVGQTMALQVMAEMQSREMIMAKITTAILGVMMNVIGAQEWGLTGVVLALVAFSVIYSLWMCWLLIYRGKRVET